MQLTELIKTFWRDVFSDKIIYLSTYKFERSKRYPGVGVRHFTNWILHKMWLQKEAKRVNIQEHNRGVMERFRAAEAERNPKKPS